MGNETIIKLNNNMCQLNNITQKWSESGNDNEGVERERLMKEFRKFNIDITPKVNIFFLRI